MTKIKILKILRIKKYNKSKINVWDVYGDQVYFYLLI